jgi:ATP-binding cassette subfamily B protein
VPEAQPPKRISRQIALLTQNVRRSIGLAFGVERGLTTRYVLASIINALLPVFIAWVGKEIVDAVVAAIAAPAHSPTETLQWVAVELALMLSAHISGQYIGYTAQLLRARLALHVDSIIFEKALRLSVHHFEDPEFMDTLERARKESSWRPLEMITHGLSLGRNLLTLIGYSLLLMQFSGWAVIALALAGLPFLAEARFAAEEYKIHAARTADERHQHYLSQLLTSDYYVKEVKLFALGKMLLGRHRAFHEKFYAEDRRFAFKRGLAVTLLGIASMGVFYGIYIVIVSQTVIGAITLGSMTLYLTVFRQGQGAFESAMSSIARAYEDNLYINNLFEYLGIPDDDIAEVDPADIKELPSGGPAIHFDNVSFRYPGSERPALIDVQLTIEPGQTIALVGPNGAGKTTLVKLLSGLYALDEGKILLGDEDISTLDRGELRCRIGVLFQDFVHYHFSAADNVGLGWLPMMADREAVKAAATAAGADDIINALPEGYDTTLGRWFGGEQLSIGQWQRMALARAFMRKSQVLILDEPTASIDAEGEHQIFERFSELKQDATAILITHRFSTVKMADRIIVLDAGRIVEDGTHAELMAQDGLFARMWNLQAETYVTHDAESKRVAAEENNTGENTVEEQDTEA